MRKSEEAVRVNAPRVFAGYLALLIVGSGPGMANDPYQVQNPTEFWLHKIVFQKRGIVIEDDDFIIRQRYWILDPNVHGKVVDVEKGDEKVWLLVHFPGGMAGGWQQKGVNVRDRMVVNTRRVVTIRPDPYGEGADVQSDEVSFSHRIEGEEVDPRKCGVIIRREVGFIEVRFPSSTMSLVSPKVGEFVKRSWDWHDGVADGGMAPTGIESCEGCIGTVTKERDEKGFVDVRWNLTGRNKSHRFDCLGYYDIEPVEPR